MDYTISLLRKLRASANEKPLLSFAISTALVMDSLFEQPHIINATSNIVQKVFTFITALVCNRPVKLGGKRKTSDVPNRFFCLIRKTRITLTVGCALLKRWSV